MPMTYHGTEEPRETRCNVLAAKSAQPAWRTTPNQTNRGYSQNQPSADFPYLDPRLLTSNAGVPIEHRRCSLASSHGAFQIMSPTGAYEDMKSPSIMITDALPSPSDSAEGQISLPSPSWSQSSDSTPRYDMTAHFMTVAEQQRLRRRTQNRRA